jgi:hypothetical protein
MPTPRKLSRARLLALAPRSPEQLRAWLRLALDIEIPCERSDPDAGTGPLAYLWHTFHEAPPGEPKKPDAVVWACRGGGKTFYAAVATVLDLVFKPGIEVKALGGSLEQSQRLHAHLRRFFERRPLEHFVDGRMTDRRVRLINTSGAEVLAQSSTSVRGARPQKLRCDEAELFDRGVWAAAQLSPRSKFINGQLIHASIEALSTCHEPYGLMSELIASAGSGADASPAKPRRLFRWGVIEILETCEKDRPCGPCAIHPECGGTAKRGVGHLRIDDALTMKSRVSANQWASEMLCLRPRRDDCVLPEFDEAIHVRASTGNNEPGAPATGHLTTSSPLTWLAGMDFGFRAPSAFLWATHDAGTNVLHVIDEHIESRLTIAQHIEKIANREWPKPKWIGIDPAGSAAEAQSGTSHANVLRKAGHAVKHRASKIEFGLGLLRARLAPASGTPTLFIHPRCRQLIESLTKYHYPPASTSSLDSAEPVKDGHDHAVDALRYLVLNLDRPLKTERTCYM